MCHIKPKPCSLVKKANPHSWRELGQDIIQMLASQAPNFATSACSLGRMTILPIQISLTTGPRTLPRQAGPYLCVRLLFTKLGVLVQRKAGFYLTKLE